MPRLVALLTDFGLKEPYVAQMKGVIYSRCPGARVVDLSHSVEPYNLAQAGFFLDSSRGYFPAGAIFVAVVDPGVGGARRMVVLEKFGQVFLAPDNGLLSLVLDAAGEARCFDLTGFGDGECSQTFHGRDVFAPFAARLAANGQIGDLLPALDPDSLVRQAWAEPAYAEGASSITAHVLHADQFGNCLLNLRIEPWLGILSAWPRITLLLPGAVPVRLVRSYQELEKGAFGLLSGSQGYLELALRQASAARELGLKSGHAVTLSCCQVMHP